MVPCFLVIFENERDVVNRLIETVCLFLSEVYDNDKNGNQGKYWSGHVIANLSMQL